MLNIYGNLSMLASQPPFPLCVHWAKKWQQNKNRQLTSALRLAASTASPWTYTILLPCPNETAEFLKGSRDLASPDKVSQKNGLITFAVKIWGKKDHQTSVGGATFKTRHFPLGYSVFCCAGILHCHQLANVNTRIYEFFHMENPFSIRSVPCSRYWGEEVLSLCIVVANAQWSCSCFWGSVNRCFFGKLWLNHCVHFSWDEG